MQKEYYKYKLYPLQDKVLDIIGDCQSPFYLTGGTALSRFYLHHRFSDDLDLFVNSIDDFISNVDKIRAAIQKNISVRTAIMDTDFARIYAISEGVELKVEFINDVAFHYGEFMYYGNIRIDHPINILSNKVTALSRNAAKDYADILFLSFSFSFNWIDIFDLAKQKDAWVNEISLADMLFQFDVSKLDGIGWIDKFDLKQYSTCFQTIAKDILKGADNSLYKS